MIGASIGKIGTAIGQQNLRGVLSYCDSPQMGAPEAYIEFTPGLITEVGEVTDKIDRAVLMRFHDGVRSFHGPRAWGRCLKVKQLDHARSTKMHW